VEAYLPASENAALAGGDQIFMLHEAFKPTEGRPRLIVLGGSVSIDALPLSETVAEAWYAKTGTQVEVLQLGTYGTSLADSFVSLLAAKLTRGSVVAVQVDSERLLDLMPADMQLALDRSLLEARTLASFVEWGRAHGISLEVRPRLLRLALAVERALYLHRWMPIEVRHVANDALAALGLRDSFACARTCWANFLSLQWSGGAPEILRHGDDWGARVRAFTIAKQISRPRAGGECRLACDLVAEMNAYVRARGGRLVLLRFPIFEPYAGLYSAKFNQAVASLADRGIPIASFPTNLPEPAFKDALHLSKLGRQMFLPDFVDEMTTFF
jgi:hypothetical protein